LSVKDVGTTTTNNVYNDIKLLSKKLESINIEIEELKKQLYNNTTEIKDTGGSVVELNRKTERLNNDIIDLMTKIETISKEISELKIKLINIESFETKIGSYNVLSQPTTFPQTVQPQKTNDIKMTSEYDYRVNQLVQEVNNLKLEIKEIKQTQNIPVVSEIKDPNLRRILTSPYLVITSVIISIFALIATF
jgi:chromosome segregation ATPase